MSLLGGTDQVRRWLHESPTPLFIALVVLVFATYALLGFEITVVMLLVLVLREVARP